MSIREIPAEDAGLPRFAVVPQQDAEIFQLDSHARARDALDFGLSVAGHGFNIFVVGEDRSARMTATLTYLGEAVARRSPPTDWIYLNNFRHPDHPTPHALPAGLGRRFRDAMATLIPKLREALAASFAADAYQAQLLLLREQTQQNLASDVEALAEAAKAQGLRVIQSEDGALRLARVPDAPAPSPSGPKAAQAERDLAAALTRIQRDAVEAKTKFAAQVAELNRGITADIASPALEELARQFSGFTGLARWLTEVRVDIIETPERFQLQPGAAGDGDLPETRYAVNLFVDHGEDAHSPVVLESNPTYENLFGRIEYSQVQGSVQTDFTQIRAGALHRANGGVLVLRAEALAVNATSWIFLKAALRDGEIRIEEPQRQDAPIAGAPKPQPIPLELKVVIVGAPRWYATFFESDSDFRTYFKVNADIDIDMAADARNLGLYGGLIAAMARHHNLEGASDGAIARLLGIAARWAARRDRLSSRVELIEDLVGEATVRSRAAREKILSEDAVRLSYAARHRRNARLEERMLQSIVEGTMMIATRGAAVGQINALTVNSSGDHRFGTPVRITARAFAGRAGIVNIERDIGMGGPIQQKGAKVLEGYLAGRFAQTRPLSFTCSITFEQVYGGVEGDSASLAELIAVLSDLARLPIRQDLAITGSVNQEGEAQAIGGAHWKVEGFHRVCAAKAGGLTGTQGVILPETNAINLVLHDDVAAAIASGQFHLWAVTTVDAAAELMLGRPVGVPDASGAFPADTIFGRIAARLDEFDRILAARLPLAGEPG